MVHEAQGNFQPVPHADPVRARDCEECRGWGTVINAEGHQLCPTCQTDVVQAEQVAGSPRSRGSPAPKAEGLTVGFDPSESLELDRWILELRVQTGIRWDKAEVVRELLRMARTPDSILCDALTARARRADA
ncbi:MULTISPECIES: hypothetical protein [unclassified Streptomyces]|uniref:hypothetical protein n=1 Tax=unclassified Streptomyces TaxID=2593676 RepID=UPI0033FA9D93